MEKIKIFIDELCQENGSIYKNAILRKWSNDKDILSFVEYYFNPFKITNISSKKIVKQPGTFIETRNIQGWDDFLLFLAKECTGKNSDIKAIQNFIKFNEEYKDMLRGVATKSIKMGISAKTINKIYGDNFVPEVKLQLAMKYYGNEDKVKGRRFSISLKLDGIRCIAIREAGTTKLITRAGRPIPECIEIEADLAKMPENIVLDGELLPVEYKAMESKAAYKKSTEIVKTQGIKRGLAFVAFDCLTYEEWDSNEGTTDYKKRFSNLRSIARELDFVKIVPRYYEGEDTAKIDEFLEKAKAHKQEGLMLNMVDDVYQFGRTTSLLKVKVMQDCDLRVIGVQEGKGKYKGTLGALIVKYKGNTVNVGSGLSEVIRKKIWSKQESIIGRVIKVQYFEETQDSEGNKSLRFPVFLEVCPKDKEPSYH